jgi:acyl carrier protein
VAAPTKAEVYEALKAVLMEDFGFRAEQIQPTAHLVNDLDLDSIDWINMAVALETRTGRKLAEEDLGAIRTVQDVVDVVHRRLQPRMA